MGGIYNTTNNKKYIFLIPIGNLRYQVKWKSGFCFVLSSFKSLYFGNQISCGPKLTYRKYINHKATTFA